MFHRDLLALSYHAGHGIRHNLRRSTERFVVWLNRASKDLIEVSSEHTPTNIPSRKSSFTTDTDDVPTVAASDITETGEAEQLTSPLFTQEQEVSASPSVSLFFSKRQPAAARIIKCGKSFGKRLMLEASGN